MITLPLLQEQVQSCTKCEISKTKNKYVFARGNPEAKLMVIGEAPGNDEDQAGLPFVGRAGQCLDRAIKSLGFEPDKDIYVANILKCHPPDNRRPTIEEIKNCRPYLKEQIKLVAPKTILALGNTAIQGLFNVANQVGAPFTKIGGITELRGKTLRCYDTQVIPTFHPSFIIRSGGVNSEHFKTFIDDIKLAFQVSKEN